MRLLFWNIRLQAPQAARAPNPIDVVVTLQRRFDIDILVLAELGNPHVSPLLGALNQPAGPFPRLWRRVTTDFRVDVFHRYPVDSINPVGARSQGNFGVLRASPPGLEPIRLAIAHLPSRRFTSREDAVQNCVELASYIRDVEGDVVPRRTLLLGDLNSDPFEDGVVAAQGLHGISSRSIVARTGSRTVNSAEYPMFYNPSWCWLGDDGDVGGSYYYRRSTQIAQFWHVFDQVMVRADLLEYCPHGFAQLLTSDGAGRSLLGPDGRPAVSDHLPLLATLELPM
ncbi:MAG: endonuclease/exonuclease/phosphatase family protein [Planctomycetota bacterium]